MKALLVIAGLCLVGVSGRVVSYRRPTRDRDFIGESVEDNFSAPSLSQEDIFEDNDGIDRERSLRASLYQPSYGYTKGYRWKFDGDGEGFKMKKPKYAIDKSQGKFSAYGKPSSKPWKGFHFGPHEVTPEFGERKKGHRSALRYSNGYQQSPQYSAPTPLVPYFKTVPPKKPCGNQIVIGCSPTVTQVPCGYTGGYYPNHQHYQESVIGSPGPVYPEQSYPAEPQDYNPQAPSYYQPPPTPSQAPVQPAQPHDNFSFRWPQTPPLQPPTPTSSPSPFHLKPSPPSSYQQPPSPSPYQPYQPTYKPSDAQPFKTPSFAPPVNEHPSEAAPHPQPHVSAFAHSTPLTLTTTTPSPTTTPASHHHHHLPTVPADRDQNYRFAGDLNGNTHPMPHHSTTTPATVASAAATEDDFPGNTGSFTDHKEASGDDAPESRTESSTMAPATTPHAIEHDT